MLPEYRTRRHHQPSPLASPKKNQILLDVSAVAAADGIRILVDRAMLFDCHLPIF